MNRSDLLRATLKERILVMDGAMGTALQAYPLTAADFGGPEFEGCNEHLVLTAPDVVREVHRRYLEAGADIIETDTFGSTALVLREYPPLDAKAYEITCTAARLAREMADAYSTEEKPRFVAGSMGPTTKAISITGGVSFEDLAENFREQARALVDGGVDYLLLETSQDTRNVKAGVIGIQRLFAEGGRQVPLAISGTIEPMGTMLAGQTVEAFITSLEHLDLLYVGLNCATGPEFMTDHIRSMAQRAPWPVACVPNAGLPDEEGRYLETPDMVARSLGRFMEHGWLNLVGGCCGTNEQHIEALTGAVAGKAPRRFDSLAVAEVSGIENLEIDEDNRPVIVGERTNVIGSRLFKRLIVDGKFEEASEIARRQVKHGAQVIDICLANPDRDEMADVERFLSFVVNKVKVPLMIDSTDAAVIEMALTYCQGKSIINSINLEDGEERFQAVVPLAKTFGAALVVGTIDEQGMAVTRDRKLDVARRSYDLLVHTYGVDPGSIIFDPLVFPCATGDAQYLGSARETIEGIRLLNEAFPRSKTILGISNVSFGLPSAGREVLNSVFLYHCTQAGLDMAIVNSEKLERYAVIPADEKELADRVLFDSGDEAINAFADHFRGQTSRVKKEVSQLSLDERLSNYILEGSKDGLVEDVDRKLKEAAPLEIINGPLMAGMDEVGRLFNQNELIVAEVLQSAEAMKAAVAHLEPLMEKADAASKGTVLLATVKGDVHDIGKNLVEIILGNNGYKVINLGIRVPPTELIQAIKEYDPDIIGLSGLLVKSAQQMVITAEELSHAGICPPMLVGGAALTRSFTLRKIGPAYDGLVVYASDAMQGLDLANRIMNPEKRKALEASLAAWGTEQTKEDAAASAVPVLKTRSESVAVLDDIPQPPDFERHVLQHVNWDEVWAYINPVMLYTRHLGLRGGRADELLAQGDEKALMLKETIDHLKAECRQGAMAVRAVWQFFEAASEGNRLYVYEPGTNRKQATFDFPRQPGENGLCLADYVNPVGTVRDNICLFAVTAGEGVRHLYEKYKAAGEYLNSHAIQALALETAEAAAEWLHSRLRAMWGFPDQPEMTMKDRFQANYRGRRYSLGYPACPDLAMQKTLFDLLHPEEIGVELTDEDMMEPEASVSAVAFHHPASAYFDASKPVKPVR